MNSETRQRAEKLLGHTFANPDLLTESLTHASVADTRLKSNERMEFLGDAVLDLIICDALYRKFPEYLEGDLTKIKSAVVSRRTCAEVSKETGLIDLLVIGKGISNREAMPSSLAAAVYESIVAAIYLDAGFEVVKEYVLRTMTPKIESIASNTHQHNYKAVLQQHAQKSSAQPPSTNFSTKRAPTTANVSRSASPSTAAASPAPGGRTKRWRSKKPRYWPWKNSGSSTRRMSIRQ